MFKSKNLTLRALEPADIDLLFKWENDEEMWYLSNTVEPFSRFTLEQYILNSHQDIFSAKQLRLLIDVNNETENKTIGSIDLFDFDPVNKRAGIGILISKGNRNKGFANEALEMLIDYGFNTLHLHQLYCNVSTHNIASLKLFKKQGFTVVGIKKEWIHVKNKWIDEQLLQLINPIDKK
jgi:diamine N-acetyltransferase